MSDEKKTSPDAVGGEPLAVVNCCASGHQYEILRKDYYKPGGNDGFPTSYDQTKSYSTLYCKKCGVVIEVKSN